MKIYVVLKTVATNDGVVTEALCAFKSEKDACRFIDKQDIDESETSPSVSLLDYQEVELEDYRMVNFKESYAKMVKLNWFKKTYTNKSVGETIEIDE